MNLYSNQTAVRNVQSSRNVRRFRAFRGLKTPRHSSALRRNDRPHTDVHTRVAVGVLCMAALPAMEAKADTVGRRDITAGRTAPACVPGINILGFNAGILRFVGDFELPLRERPAVDFCPVVFPSLDDTVSDVRQVLKNDAPCAVFNRVTDQCLGGDVQKLTRYGSLVSAEARQKAVSGTGANGLDGCLGFTDASAAVVKSAALEEKCLAVGRVGRNHQPFNPKVNTNNGAFCLRLGHINMVDQQQIPNPSDSLKPRLAPAGYGNGSGVERDNLTEDSHAISSRPHQVVARCHGHGRVLIDAQPPFTFRFQCFVGGCHLPEDVARQLRWGFKLAPHRRVKCLVQPVGVEFLGLENTLGHPVGGPQITDCDGVERLALADFDLDCPDRFQYGYNMPHLEKTQEKNADIFNRNRHSVSKLLVHLVFVVKYRRAAISSHVWDSLKSGFELAAKRIGVVLVELNHDKNHVHVIVEYPPRISVSRIANALKGNGSFTVRRECRTELHPMLWSSSFWSPSYFAASCGGAPIEVLKQYVQSQQNKAALKGGVSNPERIR